MTSSTSTQESRMTPSTYMACVIPEDIRPEFMQCTAIKRLGEIVTNQAQSATWNVWLTLDYDVPSLSTVVL
jgi:hypothetical protein